MQLFDTSKHFFKKKHKKASAEPSARLSTKSISQNFSYIFIRKWTKKSLFLLIMVRNEISKKSNFYMKNNFTFRQKLSKNNKWSFKKNYKKTSAEPSVRLSEKSIPQNISRKNPKFPKNRIFTWKIILYFVISYPRITEVVLEKKTYFHPLLKRKVLCGLNLSMLC